MSTFKIKNITNELGKRDYKYNSVLDIEYVDKMMKKTVKIKPGATVYLTLSSLPLSAHTLRVKNLITVTEIGDSELAAAIGSNAQKSTPSIVNVEKPVSKQDDESRQPKKVVIKKEKEEV